MPSIDTPGAVHRLKDQSHWDPTVATYQPEQIVLFGSHAWDEPDKSSDVDLLVVVSESAETAYVYLLTPSSAKAKLSLTRNFLARREDEFARLQHELAALRGELTIQGANPCG